MQSQSFDFMESLFSEASSLASPCFTLTSSHRYFQRPINNLMSVLCLWIRLSILSQLYRNGWRDRDENKLTKRENTSKTWFKSIITPSSSIKRSRLGYSTLHRQTFRALLMENLISEFSISMQHSSSGGRVLCGQQMKICFAFNFGNKNIQKSDFCCYFKL